MPIPFHPLADLFPLTEGPEFDALVQAIKENGLREEITLFEGAILDGRNRYRACQAAGIEVRPDQYHTYTGDDPRAFVIARRTAELAGKEPVAVSGDVEWDGRA